MFHPERWLPTDHPLYNSRYASDNLEASKPFLINCYQNDYLAFICSLLCEGYVFNPFNTRYKVYQGRHNIWNFYASLLSKKPSSVVSLRCAPNGSLY